jgi:hypothetical protein
MARTRPTRFTATTAEVAKRNADSPFLVSGSFLMEKRYREIRYFAEALPTAGTRNCKLLRLPENSNEFVTLLRSAQNRM